MREEPVNATAACLPGGSRCNESHHRFLENDRVTGIDLGAGAIYCASLAAMPAHPRRLIDMAVFGPDEIDAVVRYCARAGAVAIDAPAAPSTNPHRGSSSPSGWTTARCTELAMRGRGGGWGPPFAAPTPEAPIPPWMAVGFRLWDTLRHDGHGELFEVYPHAIFECLAKGIPSAHVGLGRLPNKKTALGQRARLTLLSQFVDFPSSAVGWGHDVIDAVGAALVADVAMAGGAEPVVCDPPCEAPDDSAIWMPTRCGTDLRRWASAQT